MKKFILPAVVISALILGSFCHPYTAMRTQPLVFADSPKTPLELYGRYIYQRENCGRCHMLQDDSTNNKMKSLDGMGKKLYSSWHYLHLKDPASMSALSTMPAFPLLFTTTINQAQLLKLYRQYNSQYRSSDAVAQYKKLQQQAKVIAGDIQKVTVTASLLQQKEIVALIAYLQQIPASAQRRYSDSLWYAAIENKKAAWDRIPLDDAHTTVMQFANSTHADTVAMGALLFKQKSCHICHGQNGGGGVGPNLTDGYWLHGSSSKQIVQTIANGVPDYGMQAFKSQLSPEEIGQLAAYIHSIKDTHPANAKMGQGVKEW